MSHSIGTMEVNPDWRSPMHTNALGEKIKELRLSKKMSQVDLSKGLSVANSTISNWENGRRLPSVNELKRIADFFGVSLSTFDVAQSEHTAYESAVRIEYNQTIDFRPIGFIIGLESRILFIASSVMIVLSTIITSVSFVFLIIGFAGLMWAMLILLTHAIRLNEIAYMKVLMPVQDFVFYEHAMSPETCTKQKKWLRKISIFLIVSDIVLMYMVFVAFVRTEKLIFNILIACLAMLVIATALFRGQTFSKSRLFEHTIPYYGVKKSLRYISIVSAMIIESINLVWLATIVTTQVIDTRTIISPFILVLLAGINSVFGYVIFVMYQAYLANYTLKARNRIGNAYCLEDLTGQHNHR